jgi:methionine-rich copper-binding protein CopC
MSKVLPLLIAALGLIFAGPAQAHSVLESSIPADGSTVAEPKDVSLTFTRAVRLVTLKLVAKDVDTSLPVDRSAPAAKSFSAPLPKLAPGTYELKWTASARDGHIMTGSFSFTVAANGAGSADQPKKP